MINKVLFLLLAVAMVGCQTPNTKHEFKLETEFDSVSYAMGLNYGRMLESQRLDSVDGDMLVQGLKDYFAKKQLFDMNVGAQTVNDYLFDRDANMAKDFVANNKAWLENNKTKEGVVTSASGLQYNIELPGSDVKPDANDIVEILYSGFLTDGTQFENSAGKSSKFNMEDGIIKGLQEGLQLIGEGGKMQLFIPAELAYGPRRGPGNNLPPYSILLFHVELVSVEKVD